jgi:hypothetical protein
MNRKRWACGGVYEVVCGHGSVYNPCLHGAEEHRRRCLVVGCERLKEVLQIDCLRLDGTMDKAQRARKPQLSKSSTPKGGYF